MSSVLKNILTLIFFLIFFNYISRVEASTDCDNLHNKLFYQTLPSWAFVNMTSMDICEIKNWETYCEIG